MIESRRRAYLDALGFDLWSSRPPEPEFDRLLLQPGAGGTLLVCETPEATATRIAGDVGRALGGEVVWAWPDPKGNPQSPSLQQAVEQHLFTRVVVFGTVLGRRIFRGAAPQVLGSASVALTGGLDELAACGSAKKDFWRMLCGPGAH